MFQWNASKFVNLQQTPSRVFPFSFRTTLHLQHINNRKFWGISLEHLISENSGKIWYSIETLGKKNKSTKKAAEHIIAKMIFFDAHVLLLQFSDPSFLINKKKYKKSLKLTIGSEKKNTISVLGWHEEKGYWENYVVITVCICYRNFLHFIFLW